MAKNLLKCVFKNTITQTYVNKYCRKIVSWWNLQYLDKKTVCSKQKNLSETTQLSALNNGIPRGASKCNSTKWFFPLIWEKKMKKYSAERKLLGRSGEHRGDVHSSDSSFEGSRTLQWNTEATWWQKMKFINTGYLVEETSYWVTKFGMTGLSSKNRKWSKAPGWGARGGRGSSGNTIVYHWLKDESRAADHIHPSVDELQG